MNVVTVKKVRTRAKQVLGLRIAHWRQQQKDFRGMPMTQAQLAKLVDVHYSSVSNWEAGLSAPRPDVMRRLLRRLGLTIQRFYEPRFRVPREGRAAS
jgi:transcriptional regulator with XRE-family HTH domain